MRLTYRLTFIFTVMTASLACVVYSFSGAPRYQGEWYSHGFFSGAGMWEVKGDQVSLKHFVFFEAVALTQSFTGDESAHAQPGASHYHEIGNRKSFHVCVEVIPRGIYLNQVRLPTTDSTRVFVMKGDRKLIPIPLTADELAKFTPEYVSQELELTPFWREVLLPLVDPGQIQQQKDAEVIAYEKKEFADMEVQGICRERVFAPFMDGNFCLSNWISYPQGVYRLESAIITTRPSHYIMRHVSNLDEGDFTDYRQQYSWDRAQLVYIETFPSRTEINGVPLETGKVSIQRPDGTLEILNLSSEEQQLFTKERVSDWKTFMTSDLFVHKIAPLMGPPTPQ